MALKALSKKLPALRLYEQIILYVALVVFIPLLTLSFIIYGINQKALKKELVRFTEHTAEIIYTDISAQMASQSAQSRLVAKVVADGLLRRRPARDVLQQVLGLPGELDAIGLYTADGEPLTALSRPKEVTQAGIGEVALPKHLSGGVTETPELRLKAVVDGDPASAKSPVRYVLHIQQRLPDAGILQQRPGRPHSLVMQVRADYLSNLVHSQNEKLYKGFFLVDAHGNLIAGPDSVMRSWLSRLEGRSVELSDDVPMILEEQNNWQKTLAGLKPGVSQVLAQPDKPTWLRRVFEWLSPVGKAMEWVWVKTPLSDWLSDGYADEDEDADENKQPVEKVLMKLPNGWGVVVESPYQVRQKYIKRARTQTLLLLLAHLLLVGGFTIIYISGMRRNFRQLIKGIQALAEGRYSRRIRLITNWFTPFEIVFLAGEFNRMSRRREEAWDESQTLTQELRQANDKLAELDKMKSNLIDTVSHELRTPLTSIKGYTSRLIRYDDTLDSDTRLKSLKTIKRQADRLNRLVDDLLVIPELEQHHLRVALSPVKLRPLIDRSIASVVQSQRTDVLVDVVVSFIDADGQPLRDDDTDSAPVPWVFGDSDRLEQILVNLLDNAIKYGVPEQPIRVQVSPSPWFTAKHQAGWQVMVSNACPPEVLPASQEVVDTLFEKFKRMDDTTTRTTRGTGLGLFITRGLVEAMGGVISARVDDNIFSIGFELAEPTDEVLADEGLPHDDALLGG